MAGRPATVLAIVLSVALLAIFGVNLSLVMRQQQSFDAVRTDRAMVDAELAQLGSIKAQHADLDGRVKQKKIDLEGLQDQVRDLEFTKRQREQAVREREDAVKSQKEAEAARSDAEAAARNARNEHGRTTEALQTVQNDIQQANRQREAQRVEIGKFKADRLSAETDKQAAVADAATAIQGRDLAQRNLQRAQSDLLQVQQDLPKAQQDLQVTQAGLITGKNDASATEARRAQAQSEVQSLTAQIPVLKAAVVDAENKKTATVTSLSTAQGQLDSTRAELDRSQASIRSLTALKEQLTQETAQKSALERQREGLLQEIGQKSVELNKVRADLIQADADRKAAQFSAETGKQAGAATAIQERDLAQKTLQTAQASLITLKNDASATEARRAQAESEVQSLTAQIPVLKAAAVDAENKKTETLTSLSTAQGQLDSTRAELDRSQASIRSLTALKEQLTQETAQKSALERQREGLLQDIGQKSVELNKIRADLIQADADRKAAQQSAEAAGNAQSNQERIRRALTDEIPQLKGQLDGIKTEKADRLTELGKLQTAIQQRQGDLDRITARLRDLERTQGSPSAPDAIPDRVPPSPAPGK